MFKLKSAFQCTALLFTAHTSTIGYAGPTVCKFFDGDFSEHELTMEGNTSYSNLSDASWTERTWHGHFIGWRHHEIDWNDKISSAVLIPNAQCHFVVLRLFSDFDFGGTPIEIRSGYGQEKWVSTAEFNERGWNDRTSSAICSCIQISPNETWANHPAPPAPANPWEN